MRVDVPNPWTVGLSVMLALGGLWLAPISPLSLSTGDVAMGMARPVLAVAQYDSVARWSVLSTTRRAALRRSAAVHTAELNDLNGARQRLLLLLEEDLGIAERADVLAEIGALWEHEYRPARAGASWLAAAEADPESPQSVERRAAAAAAFGEAGRVQKATRLWVEVVQADERWRARGNLARAGLMLAQGRPTQALPLYEDVVRVGDDDERAAGRLGASVCLERLGNLDEALAEIDAAELPDGVRATRANSLRARQYWAP